MSDPTVAAAAAHEEDEVGHEQDDERGGGGPPTAAAGGPPELGATTQQGLRRRRHDPFPVTPRLLCSVCRNRNEPPGFVGSGLCSFRDEGETEKKDGHEKSEREKEINIEKKI